MECFNCKTLLCCPEHCCDWDSCDCKDCENCGGSGTSKPTPPSPPSPPSPTPNLPSREKELSITDYIHQQVQIRMKEQREQDAKAQAEYEAKQKIEHDRHEAILSASRATIAKNKQVLESTQGTLDKLQNTIKGIKETERKFKEFQDTFGQVMSTALEKCFGKDENLEEMIEKHGKPREGSVDEVAELLAKASNAVFIIGAGVSAESGLFTYKDNEETWEIEGTQMKIQDAMDINVLQSSPLDFWQLVQYTRMRVAHCSPNIVHYFLSDLVYLFRNVGRKVSIVTQNFDGLERQIMGQDSDLYEIEGNLSEMRCLFECCDGIFPAPELDEMLYGIPLCPVCSAICRPNVLLEGEEGNEKFYKVESAENAIKMADVMIVMGTQLERGFAKGMVKEFVKEGKVVVEVNVEPVIGYGQVLVLPYRCAEVAAGLMEKKGMFVN